MRQHAFAFMSASPAFLLQRDSVCTLTTSVAEPNWMALHHVEYARTAAPPHLEPASAQALACDRFETKPIIAPLDPRVLNQDVPTVHQVQTIPAELTVDE